MASHTQPAHEQPIVSFRGAVKEFRVKGKETLRAVDKVSFDVAAGSVVGVVGYSGAGKSTLVRLINALELPTTGDVIVQGTSVATAGRAELKRLRSGIGMVFQQFNLFQSRTVRGNIAYPLRLAGATKQQIAERVDELLDFVGLADKADSYPRRLSGGQKQRVGIARALATSPALLLADEATSALDPETTTEVLGLLKRINRELGTTIVVITHEMSVVRELCDRVVMMEKGRVVEEGDTYSVFSAPRTEATRAFVSTAIQGRPGAATLARLRGRHPGPLLALDIGEDFSSIDVAELAEKHGVRAAVVYGGVTELGERSVGTLTYALDGDPTAVRGFIDAVGERTTAAELGEEAAA